MKRLSYEPTRQLESQPRSVEQIWHDIRPYTTPISVGVHSYLPDGRPLHAGYATGLLSGSFKERGALTEMLELHAKGHTEVAVFSAGNHLAGAALGGRALRMSVKGFVPGYTPPGKIEKSYELGEGYVDIEQCEGDLVEAAEKAQAYADKHEVPLLVPFNSRLLGLGQGTVGYELLQRVQGIDHLIVPGGGFGLGLGCIEAIKQAGLRTKVHAAKLTSDLELCEGAFVSEFGPVGKRTIAQNPELWGGILKVKPSDVGEVALYEDAVRLEHSAAMCEAAYDEYPEATALLGAAAAHKYFDKLDGRIAVLITGSNADPTNLEILRNKHREKQAKHAKKHREKQAKHAKKHIPSSRTLQVASGYQLRRSAA